MAGCASGDKVGDTTLVCTDDVGYARASLEARQGLDRANCYRLGMGLEPGSLSAQLDAATQAHAEYMAVNQIMTHQEESGMAGYSGDWVWDRIDTVGYDCCVGQMVSEVVAVGHDPAGAVDAWVQSVYHRLPFTLPHWIEVGVGQADDYSAMTFMTPFPSGPRDAVIYPSDGQTGVPSTFNSDWESPDPAPDLGVVGTPITVTVSDEVVGVDDLDPHELRLISASLKGPGGASVEVMNSDPQSDTNLMQMAVMLPVSPLQAGAVYVATMTVEWSGETETLIAEFTTAP
jgi:hypothetical protein